MTKDIILSKILQMSFAENGFKKIILFFFLLTAILVISSASSPLEGVHQTRQADTLFTAFSYCTENASFFYPRIIHRENSPGVSIGEFPLWSYFLSLPCKATGYWSESLPKYFSFVFLLFNILVWWTVLKQILRRSHGAGGFNGEFQSQFPYFFAIFFFSTQSLSHYLIPLPDVFALFIAGAAAFFAQRDKLKPGSFILATLLMTLAFAIRPYLLPLFVFLIPLPLDSFKQIFRKKKASLFLLGLTLITSFVFYLWWYRSWIRYSDIAYYNTSVISPLELLYDLPRIFLGIWTQIVRNHLHFVGALILIYLFGLKKIDHKSPWTLLLKQFLLYALAAFLFVVIIKGDHFVNHGYYLSAASLFLFFALFALFELLPEKSRKILMILYILIGLVNTQHLFWRNTAKESEQLQALILRHQVGLKEKVVTYLGTESNSTASLYLIKRTGWAWAESDYPEKGCPDGADWKIWKENGEFQIGKCR